MLGRIKKEAILSQLMILLCLFGLCALPCYGGVIFEDNFDSQADWNTDLAKNGDGCYLPCSDAPANWSYYRETPGSGTWTNPVGSIRRVPANLPDHTNGTGKAYIVYNQSHPVDNWPGDSILGKILLQDYPELYFRIWIRTQANWQSASSATSKVVRVSHYDGIGNVFENFSTGSQAPILLWFFGADYLGRGAHALGFRCSPQSSYYYCTAAGVPSYQLTDTLEAWGSGGPTGYFADTQWHRYDFRVKMNDPGSNNGVTEWWYDGVLMDHHTDVQFKASSGSSAAMGWNNFSIGGNSDNSYATQGDQWYAIDDVVVSTTPIPDNYVIGGGGADTTPPTAPRGIRIR